MAPRGRGRAHSGGRRGGHGGRHHVGGRGLSAPPVMLPGNLPTQPVGRLSDAEGPAIIHIEGVPLAVQEADLHSSLVEGGIQGYLRVQMIQRPDHAFGMANATFETRFDAERAVIRLQEMFQWNHDNNNWVPTCIQIKMRTNLLDMATRLARIKALDDAAKDLIEDDIASGDADHGSELGSPRAHDGGTPRGDKRKAPEDGPEDGGGPSKRRRVIIPADGDAAAGGPLPPPPPPPATDPGTDWQRIIEANLQQGSTQDPQIPPGQALPPPPSTVGVSRNVLAASRQGPQPSQQAQRPSIHGLELHQQASGLSGFLGQGSGLQSQASNISIISEDGQPPDPTPLGTGSGIPGSGPGIPGSNPLTAEQPDAATASRPLRRVVVYAPKPSEGRQDRPSSRERERDGERSRHSSERDRRHSADQDGRHSSERDHKGGSDRGRKGTDRRRRSVEPVPEAYAERAARRDEHDRRGRDDEPRHCSTDRSRHSSADRDRSGADRQGKDRRDRAGAVRQGKDRRARRDDPVTDQSHTQHSRAPNRHDGRSRSAKGRSVDRDEDRDRDGAHLSSRGRRSGKPSSEEEERAASRDRRGGRPSAAEEQPMDSNNRRSQVDHGRGYARDQGAKRSDSGRERDVEFQRPEDKHSDRANQPAQSADTSAGRSAPGRDRDVEFQDPDPARKRPARQDRADQPAQSSDTSAGGGRPGRERDVEFQHPAPALKHPARQDRAGQPAQSSETSAGRRASVRERDVEFQRGEEAAQPGARDRSSMDQVDAMSREARSRKRRRSSPQQQDAQPGRPVDYSREGPQALNDTRDPPTPLASRIDSQPAEDHAQGLQYDNGRAAGAAGNPGSGRAFDVESTAALLQQHLAPLSQARADSPAMHAAGSQGAALSPPDQPRSAMDDAADIAAHLSSLSDEHAMHLLISHMGAHSAQHSASANHQSAAQTAEQGSAQSPLDSSASAAGRGKGARTRLSVRVPAKPEPANAQPGTPEAPAAGSGGGDKQPGSSEKGRTPIVWVAPSSTPPKAAALISKPVFLQNASSTADSGSSTPKAGHEGSSGQHPATSAPPAGKAGAAAPHQGPAAAGGDRNGDPSTAGNAAKRKAAKVCKPPLEAPKGMGMSLASKPFAKGVGKPAAPKPPGAGPARSALVQDDQPTSSGSQGGSPGSRNANPRDANRQAAPSRLAEAGSRKRNRSPSPGRSANAAQRQPDQGGRQRGSTDQVQRRPQHMQRGSDGAGYCSEDAQQGERSMPSTQHDAASDQQKGRSPPRRRVHHEPSQGQRDNPRPVGHSERSPQRSAHPPQHPQHGPDADRRLRDPPPQRAGRGAGPVRGSQPQHRQPQPSVSPQRAGRGAGPPRGGQRQHSASPHQQLHPSQHSGQGQYNQQRQGRQASPGQGPRAQQARHVQHAQQPGPERRIGEFLGPDESEHFPRDFPDRPMGGSHRRIIANPDQHPDFPREADAVDDGFPGASRMSGPGMVLGGRGMHPGASQHFLGMTGPGISPMDSRMGPRMMPGNGMRPGPGYSRPEDELNYPRFDDRFEPEPDRQMRTGDMHLGPGMPMSDDFARNGLMPHQDLGPGLHGNGMMPDQDMPFRDTPARPARHIETGNGPMHSFPHADEMDDFPPHLAGGEGQPRQHLGGMQPSNQGGGRLKGSSGGHGPRHISNEQYPPGDLGNLPRFMQEGIRDVVQHWSPHLRLEHFNTRVVNCIGTLQPTQMGVLLNRMRHTIEWDNLKFPPSFIVSTIKSLRKHQA